MIGVKMTKLKCWKKITSFAWADTEHSGITIGRDWFGQYGQKEKFFVERFPSTMKNRKFLKKNISSREQADSFAMKYMKDNDRC